MINFRYHLVSVTAVFLALAIGLVLGTTALNGPTMDALSETVSSLRGDNESLRDQVVQLEEDAADEQEFASEAAPAMLNGVLEDESVAVLSIGAASPEHVDGVVSMLGHSSAKPVGQLTFTDEFVNPSSSDKLTDLVAELTPSDFDPPNNVDGVESASALLAAALFAEEPAISKNDRDAVITALEELNMVTVDEKLGDGATAIVIVTGTPYTDAEAADRNANTQTFLDQFGQQGPTVVASTYVDG
ncbi:MAG: copper transporter, partial [Stackebrandtia sp.]